MRFFDENAATAKQVIAQVIIAAKSREAAERARTAPTPAKVATVAAVGL